MGLVEHISRSDKRLPAIAVIAWAWLGQVPDPWTFAGAAMIVSATVLLARL